MMISFNDFVIKHNLKRNATGYIKIYEVLKNIKQDSKKGIYLRDDNFQQIIV